MFLIKRKNVTYNCALHTDVFVFFYLSSFSSCSPYFQLYSCTQISFKFQPFLLSSVDCVNCSSARKRLLSIVYLYCFVSFIKLLSSYLGGLFPRLFFIFFPSTFLFFQQPIHFLPHKNCESKFQLIVFKSKTKTQADIEFQHSNLLSARPSSSDITCLLTLQ